MTRSTSKSESDIRAEIDTTLSVYQAYRGKPYSIEIVSRLYNHLLELPQDGNHEYHIKLNEALRERYEKAYNQEAYPLYQYNAMVSLCAIIQRNVHLNNIQNAKKLFKLASHSIAALTPLLFPELKKNLQKILDTTTSFIDIYERHEIETKKNASSPSKSIAPLASTTTTTSSTIASSSENKIVLAQVVENLEITVTTTTQRAKNAKKRLKKKEKKKVKTEEKRQTKLKQQEEELKRQKEEELQREINETKREISEAKKEAEKAKRKAERAKLKAEKTAETAKKIAEILAHQAELKAQSKAKKSRQTTTTIAVASLTVHTPSSSSAMTTNTTTTNTTTQAASVTSLSAPPSLSAELQPETTPSEETETKIITADSIYSSEMSLAVYTQVAKEVQQKVRNIALAFDAQAFADEDAKIEQKDVSSSTSSSVKHPIDLSRHLLTNKAQRFITALQDEIRNLPKSSPQIPFLSDYIVKLNRLAGIKSIPSTHFAGQLGYLAEASVALAMGDSVSRPLLDLLAEESSTIRNLSAYNETPKNIVTSASPEQLDLIFRETECKLTPSPRMNATPAFIVHHVKKIGSMVREMQSCTLSSSHYFSETKDTAVFKDSLLYTALDCRITSDPIYADKSGKNI